MASKTRVVKKKKVVKRVGGSKSASKRKSSSKAAPKKRASSKSRGGAIVGAGKKKVSKKVVKVKGGARQPSAYNKFVKKFMADFKKSADYDKYTPAQRMSLAAKSWRNRK